MSGEGSAGNTPNEVGERLLLGPVRVIQRQRISHPEQLQRLGEPTTLASGQFGPAGIAVDATSVYWTNLADGTVMKLTPK